MPASDQSTACGALQAISCAVVLAVVAGHSSLAAASVPDLNGGTWMAVDPPQALRTLDGQEPPLLPQGRAAYDHNRAARTAGNVSFDDTEQCLPPGIPRILTAMPDQFEFLQRPKQIVITYEWNHSLRIVDMNVPQREIIAPTFFGQSVGKWVDGSLVIDTAGFNNSTLLDNSGLPHSDALHLTEKYTPSADGRFMTVLLTIDDPQTYARSWQTELRLRHLPRGRMGEDYCYGRKHINLGNYNDTTGHFKERTTTPHDVDTRQP